MDSRSIPPRAAFPARAPPGRRRRRLAAAVALATLASSWAGVHLWANSAPVRERIRGRAETALRSRLGAVEVGEARVDWLGRAEVGPLRVPASRPGRPPVLEVGETVVRPRWTALLAGRLEPGAVTFRRVRVAPGPGGEELRALAARLRAPPDGARTGSAGPPVDPPSLRVRDLVVALDRGGQELLEVGPFGADLDLSRDAAGAVSLLRGRLLLPGGGRVAGELRRGESAAELRADIQAALPGDLPAAVSRRLPVALSAGRIEGRVDLRTSQDLRTGSGRVELRARGVALAGRLVGPEPLGPFEAAGEGQVRWDAGARTASLETGHLSLGRSGRVGATMGGSIRLGPDPRISVEIVADRVEWRDLLAALPAPLHPPDAAPEPNGSFSARFRLEGPPAGAAAWKVDADLDLEELRRASRARSRSWILSPFRWKPVDPAPGEPPREIEVGPANPLFVPLAELPPWLPRAITASEDAGFYGHRGFDFQEMAAALGRGGDGRLRGASTITQQVAKNLFLSPERTLSRKGREALSTLALESAIPKARLLEVYLNVAEWGPGVYGVGEAARFWLGKEARDVTPKEAAFLASVIPSPRRFHARLLRTGVSGWWAERIADILSKMWIQGQLSDDQLLRALDEPLSLAPAPARPEAPAVRGGPEWGASEAGGPVADPGVEPEGGEEAELDPGPPRETRPPSPRAPAPDGRPSGPSTPTTPR